MKTFKSKAVLLTLVYLTIAIGIYTLSIARMCPDHYTQAQVDATGCTIGANIGAGVLITFLTLVWAVALIDMTHRRKTK